VIRACKVCNVEFPARTNYKCCSPECSKTNQKRRMKAWNGANPERISEFRERFNSRLVIESRKLQEMTI
jgi:hypothetical protein